MALKGSKTEGNLKAAFAGESQANRRYLYFAKKADVEGYNDVAAVFRSTAPSNPTRHLKAAELMGADVSGKHPMESGDILANAIIELIKKIHIPNGLGAIGYKESDSKVLAKGAMPQHRVIKLSPRPVTESDLTKIFMDSMKIW